MYIYSCVEYFQIFSFANELTKRGRVWTGMGGMPKQSRGCIATSYLPLSDIAKLQSVHYVSGDSKYMKL
jgi:hypothetical protein